MPLINRKKVCLFCSKKSDGNRPSAGITVLLIEAASGKLDFVFIFYMSSLALAPMAYFSMCYICSKYILVGL